jgi:perosamine synthetase
MRKINWPVWPQYGRKEKFAINKVLASNQLFSAKQVKLFEKNFSKFIGSKFAIGVGNATQGLHLALAALDIGENDEVITTPFSWISSASCILMQNAIPVFADCNEKTLALDPNEVKKKISKHTKAIIYVHPFGYPSDDINIIYKIAKKHGINLIEDASHAHGLKINGRYVGNFSDISVFSLHQRKAIPVGDGGVIITKNKKLYEKIKRLRSFGDQDLSYNYRMTEFAASLGCVRLRRLKKDNEIRIKNANYLIELFKNDNHLEPLELHNLQPVYYKFLFKIKEPSKMIDKSIVNIQKKGIPLIKTRKGWNLLHRHPHFNPRPNLARGIPWKKSEYKGQMKSVIYNKLKFPKIEYIVDQQLLELDISPPVNKNLLTKLYRLVKEEFNKINL